MSRRPFLRTRQKAGRLSGWRICSGSTRLMDAHPILNGSLKDIDADIEALGAERGHRTLVITRKGGKVVTIPLAPRTARAIDLAIGERGEGPIFLAPDGRRLDRHGAGRIVRRIARRAGITKPIGPHMLRHAFITAALDAGVPLRDVQEAASHADPRTTMRYARAGPDLTGPARHLHRRRLPRRSRQVKPRAGPALIRPDAKSSGRMTVRQRNDHRS
jgi:integrase